MVFSLSYLESLQVTESPGFLLKPRSAPECYFQESGRIGDSVHRLTSRRLHNLAGISNR
jgi:hypothetical protein